MNAAAPPGTDKLRLSFLDLHQEEYARQVRRYLVGRVLIVLLTLAILLVYEEGSPSRFNGAYLSLVLGLTLATLHLGALRLYSGREALVLSAVILDVLLAIVVAYFTGGIYNVGFSFLFIAAILSAVVLISDPSGYAIASLGTALLACITFGYWFMANGPLALPFLNKAFTAEIVQETSLGRMAANLIGVGFAFHAVAFLGSRLPRRLSQAHVLYDEILERMREGVVAIDRRGRILLANSEARRLLNWTEAGPLVGRRFQDVLRRREDQQVLELLARGENSTVELELQIRDRDPQTVEVKTTVFSDEVAGEERVRGVVGIFSDQSLRQRAEQAETRLARLLDIEQIALGIAHEIRNPLGSIRGAVQELADHTLTSEADQKLAKIVRRESDRLDRLIQEFLDFARMRPPVRGPLEVGGLVEETATMLEKDPQVGEVTIRHEIEGDFPVMGDADQLSQALLNIGVNALEALQGSGELEFRVRETVFAQRTGEGERVLETLPAVEVAISNDGPPIEPEVARQLFTPFYTTKKRGLGLGMAITQKVLRNHGGDVSCVSQAAGACFRVVLPLHRPAGAQNSG